MLAAGRTLDSMPADFAQAMLEGKVTVELLKRYFSMESNFFLKFVWGIQGEWTLLSHLSSFLTQNFTSESTHPPLASSLTPSPPPPPLPPAGFRERLLGDPSFPVKVGIECGIGVVTKVTAEKTKREDNFWREIDFVGANVLMAIIADFMLTWIPAPTLSFT
jgi:hypothetical protein